MERDKIITECRKLTARLNELHKALAELGVQVAVVAGSTRTHCLYGGAQVQQMLITVSYTQTL